MVLRFNPLLENVIDSPVTAAHAWVSGRVFPSAKPLLDIAQAVPAYAPASELTTYLAARVQAQETSRYTDNFGLPALRQALATQFNSDYQGQIEAGQITITAGCNQGFCTVSSALAQPGDEILLPLPFYFNHQMWLEMQGICPVHIPFNASAIPSTEAAAELITPRTRAIALVSPNNPTGAEYPPAVIKAFYELAQRHDLALILDETYKDFRQSDRPAHDLFQDPDWPQTLVQLYSFSKSYSLTGYRVGAITCSVALRQQIAKIIDCVTICAPRIGQEAALFGLTHLNDWVAGKCELMRSRLVAVKAAFQHPDLRYDIVASGAYFAYVKHPFRGECADVVAKRLVDEQHILCLPGSSFGPGQDDYLRFAFANLDETQMPTLLERLLASQAH